MKYFCHYPYNVVKILYKWKSIRTVSRVEIAFHYITSICHLTHLKVNFVFQTVSIHFIINVSIFQVYSTNKYNKDRISSFPYILYPDVSSQNLAQLKVSWSVLVLLDVVNRNDFSFSILKKQMFIKSFVQIMNN